MLNFGGVNISFWRSTTNPDPRNNRSLQEEMQTRGFKAPHTHGTSNENENKQHNKTMVKTRVLRKFYSTYLEGVTWEKCGGCAMGLLFVTVGRVDVKQLVFESLVLIFSLPSTDVNSSTTADLSPYFWAGVDWSWANCHCYSCYSKDSQIDGTRAAKKPSDAD